MDDLIEALQIFRKYTNTQYPTHCEHDEMFIALSPSLVDAADLKRLDELGFNDDGDDTFHSFRFGSC